MTCPDRPSGATIIATLTIAMLMAPNLTAVPPQPPAGQAREAREMFRGREAVKGEVLVAFRRSPDLARLRTEIDSDGDAVIGSGRLWHARSRSRNVASLIAYLQTRSDVLYAEPNYIVYADNLPNDPRFPELWGLQNIGQTIGELPGTPGADIKAVTAWDGALGSRNTVIGVVDTGIDYTHPDLAANVWSAPASFSVTIGGQTITCAAGTHGFNAINKTCDPFDDHFHGTHVSGTIGAVGNNGTGVAGVNWFASIMGLKFLNAGGAGNVAGAINVIEFAVQAKAAFPGGGANVRILSNSWAGGGFSQSLLDEITRANQSDMLFVAAAGNAASNNDSMPTYPASYAVPNVVAVAAINNQDALASFSNYGASSVHLGAPGVQILSTVPGATYAYFNGTSMATPHVSGAAALLLSRCAADTAALKSLLLDNVEPIPSLSATTITGGRLNLGRAIEACGPAGNTSPVVTLTDPVGETTYPAPASIPLAADAFDGEGTVSQVAFYAGTALIGIDSTAPFGFTWTGAAIGNHSVTAVATDNDGATATSAAATVRVLPGAASFGGTAPLIPGVVEAERFNEGGEGVAYHDSTSGNTGLQFRQTDVDIETASDVGGGYSLGWVTRGEWVAYSIWASTAADYTLGARVASLGSGGVFHVEVDGIDATGPMVVPNTGGWQTWQTISRPGIPLAAGPHVLRVVVDSKGTNGYLGNLNYLKWTAPGLNAAPAVQLTSPASGATYTAPATVALSATAGDLDGTVTQVAFYNGAALLGVDTTSPFTFSWTNVPIGDYSLTAIATDDAGATTTSGSATIHVTATASPTPFNGTPAAIPGVIEAENFDEGGEGVSYHDLTAANTGGQYRQTGVDIEKTSDVGGGFSLGFVAAGEWLQYSVSVAATGVYTLEARVASSGTGGTVHVEVDGVDATGPMTVPNTGGWQTWRPMAVGGIPLTAGSHMVRFVVDANGPAGYAGNVNSLRWLPYAPPTPFGGTAAPVPGLIEAENFDEGGEGIAYHDLTSGNITGAYRQTDVDLEATADTGGGYHVGYLVKGEWLKYSAVAGASGSYTLQVRVASLNGGTFHFEVDGVNVTGTLNVPATGGWQTWQTITRTGINLTAGPHVFRLVVDGAGPSGFFANVNYFRWIAE